MGQAQDNSTIAFQNALHKSSVLRVAEHSCAAGIRPSRSCRSSDGVVCTKDETLCRSAEPRHSNPCAKYRRHRLRACTGWSVETSFGSSESRSRLRTEPLRRAESKAADPDLDCAVLRDNEKPAGKADRHSSRRRRYRPGRSWRLRSCRTFNKHRLLRAPRPEERTTIQHTLLKLFEIEIDDRRYIQRYELRDDQSTNHYESERTSRRSISTVTECDRHRAKHRCERRHQNRPEPVHTRIVNSLIRRLACLDAMTREIHDHDSVLLYDTHQHKHADERVQRSHFAKHYQREQTANERSRQS